MSCNTVTFKRGTSFAASVVFTPETPPGLQDLLGVTVTSSVVDAKSNEYNLVTVLAGNGLSFTATYPLSTAAWTIGTAKWDIRFSIGGTVFFSDTMRLDVIGQVTTN